MTLIWVVRKQSASKKAGSVAARHGRGHFAGTLDVQARRATTIRRGLGKQSGQVCAVRSKIALPG